MNHNFKKGLLISAIFLVIIIALYYFGIGGYLSLEKIQQKSAALKIAVQTNYFFAVLIFCLIYSILIAATLPVVGPLTLLGGYLFGLVPGFMYSLLSATFGSILSFIIIRYALSSIMRNRYKHRLEKFNKAMEMHGASYLLMLQVLSIVPYVVINTLAALTNVSLFTMIFTTLLGSIPLIFIYAWAGKQLGTISSMKDIVSGQLFIILILLALLALVPIVIKKYKKVDDI